VYLRTGAAQMASYLSLRERDEEGEIALEVWKCESTDGFDIGVCCTYH